MSLTMRSTKKAITAGDKLGPGCADSNIIPSLTYNCVKHKKQLNNFQFNP